MPIKVKEVQTHFECVCGRNVVDHESMLVKWRDFSKVGIRRKKDQKTGKPPFPAADNKGHRMPLSR